MLCKVRVPPVLNSQLWITELTEVLRAALAGKEFTTEAEFLVHEAVKHHSADAPGMCVFLTGTSQQFCKINQKHKVKNTYC